MTKEITLSIATRDEEDRVTFNTVGDCYSSLADAMAAAKKLAGRRARYTGDGLSIRYSGPKGTVYVSGRNPVRQ